jgi:hypothetical protein
MANSTVNVQQVYEVQGDEIHEDLPVDAAAVIFEGDACSANAGNIRHLTVADANFAGFAVRKADNTGGAAGAISARVRQRGHIVLTVAAGGVLAGSVADRGLAVYATDGATFTGLNTGAVQVGKIERFISGSQYVVAFEADTARSI